LDLWNKGADEAAWGTLGVPEDKGGARLLHRVTTRRAALRHAFYAPGARVPTHVHRHAHFVYGVGGPCVETGEDGRGSKRRLNFHPAGHAHSLAYAGPTHVLVIELTGFDAALPPRSVALPATFYGPVWDIMTRVVGAEPSEEIDVAIAALVAGTSRFSTRRPPRWFARLLDAIHEEWRSPPGTAELAARFGLSPGHLCHAFKRATGVTLQHYALLLRIDRARALLWGSENAHQPRRRRMRFRRPEPPHPGARRAFAPDAAAAALDGALPPAGPGAATVSAAGAGLNRAARGAPKPFNIRSILFELRAKAHSRSRRRKGFESLSLPTRERPGP
jgi:AraC-like DNA-binding protein/quercetin dioxygenase-like cupin family protein